MKMFDWVRGVREKLVVAGRWAIKQCIGSAGRWAVRQLLYWPTLGILCAGNVYMSAKSRYLTAGIAGTAAVLSILTDVVAIYDKQKLLEKKVFVRIGAAVVEAAAILGNAYSIVYFLGHTIDQGGSGDLQDADDSKVTASICAFTQNTN